MTPPSTKFLVNISRYMTLRSWRWIVPTALLAASGLYVAVTIAQSDEPYRDQPIGWITRPLLSNNNLSSGNETVFRADFNKTTGSGSLFAYKIDGSGNVQSAAPSGWAHPDAGVLLKSQNPLSERRIFTVNNAGAAVPFVWDRLSDTQKASLGDGSTGPKVLNFLRGDASDEGNGAGQFRIRSTPLGTIVHSTLLRWNHSSGQRIYVGANDGMLHAFDASNGRELFAYVPSMLIPRLAVLAQPDYKPQAYVNGPLDIANINDNGRARTVLVGGLGNGGKGLFALDVSASSFNSDTDAARTLLWEISPSRSGFGNLGYTYALPRLARLDNGTPVVVVGNGYRSDSGKASLFLINALTGALIREIDTGVGDAGNNRNGLSSPTLLDTNGDGRMDTAYAGDLLGNLWKFNLSTGGKTRVFTTSPAQAITTAPALRRHPIEGQLVIFGTGQVLENRDLIDTDVHAVYGIWDSAPSANTALLQQSVTEVAVAGKRWRVTSNNEINWDNNRRTLHKGWKLSLPPGERVLGEPPYIADNRFVFAAMNPTTPSGANVGPGENWMMQISVFNGGNLNNSIFDVNNDRQVSDADKAQGQVVNGSYMADALVSQPVLTDLSSLSRTLFNYNPETSMTVTVIPGETITETITEIVSETITEVVNETVVDTNVTTTPPVVTQGGISNGHFDVDIYYGGGNRKHVHEYDDKYNVVGVNFLNPSDAAFNVRNAFNPGTPFKVLVANQYLNPASLLRVGDGGYARVKDFQGQASAASPDFVTGLPAFRSANMGGFSWRLPADAFQSKDWWGDGSVRAGLIPTQTGCVNKAFNATPGRNGEIYNGSLTLQMIRPETPPSVLELNFPAGGPKYGWRVKAANRAAYVLGEYTMFWHHPNGRCYNQASWVPNPPQDPDGKAGGSPPRGTADPTSGTTPNPTDGPVTAVNTAVVVNGNVTTTTVTFSDGSTRVTTQTARTVTRSVPKTINREVSKTISKKLPDTTRVTFTDRNGGEVTNPKKLCVGGINLATGQPCELECPTGEKAPCKGPDEDPFVDGRFSWRELRSSN